MQGPIGSASTAERRAVVPGVHTSYDDIPRHRVTVRRLEITGSRDKGVYWRAGDDVVFEDLVVHDNRGSPSIYLEYVSRSGHASSRFTLRSSHIYSQKGECVYIGGSEGEDLDAHARVVIENNLIHDCRSRFSTENDGINIKDRIGEAVVRRNVVFHTDWGIELASPGLYTDNGELAVGAVSVADVEGCVAGRGPGEESLSILSGPDRIFFTADDP
jgi:hypothetical protein